MSDNIIAKADTSIIDSMKYASNDLYTSFPIETLEDKISVYNAMSGSGESLKSNANKVINMVDVIVVPVDLTNDDGTISKIPRTTIIAEDGTYYSSTSYGVYNSIRKISAVFGGLHFDPPLKISPVEVKTKNGFTINIKLV